MPSTAHYGILWVAGAGKTGVPGSVQRGPRADACQVFCRTKATVTGPTAWQGSVKNPARCFTTFQSQSTYRVLIRKLWPFQSEVFKCHTSVVDSVEHRFNRNKF